MADSPAALARNSEFVFVCVTGSPQVEEALAGANGLLGGAGRGLVVVDCSTAEPDSTAKLRALCAQSGVALIDAPLARTPVEAEAGKLNVMVGADARRVHGDRAAVALLSPRTCSTSAGRAPATRSSC